MGRLVEPEKYDPKKHILLGPIMLDRWAVKYILPIVIGLIIVLIVGICKGW